MYNNCLLFFVAGILFIAGCGGNRGAQSDTGTFGADSVNIRSVPGQTEKLPYEEWLGIYEYTSPEYTDGLITLSQNYTITVTRDTCLFEGIGYQLYFIDLCTVEMNADTMIFHYVRTLDGNSYQDIESYWGKLFKKGDAYYINSPVIFNEDGQNHVDLEVNRTELNFKPVSFGTYRTAHEDCDILIRLNEDASYQMILQGTDSLRGIYDIVSSGDEIYIDFDEISGLYFNDTILIQNYGNAMNEYIHFDFCDEKYIYMIRENVINHQSKIE